MFTEDWMFWLAAGMLLGVIVYALADRLDARRDAPGAKLRRELDEALLERTRLEIELRRRDLRGDDWRGEV